MFTNFGMRRDLCTDLMASGSWILTMISALMLALCLQPARIIVPEVSYHISFQLVIQQQINSMRKYHKKI